MCCGFLVGWWYIETVSTGRQNVTIRVGIANQSSKVTAEQVKRAAAALDLQVRRDLGPVWGVDAEVVPLDDPHTIPKGVHPIIVVDETPNGVAGFHRIEQGVTWAMVSTKRDWRLAASHECLEMLVDPTGMDTRPSRGMEIVGGRLKDTDEVVDYILEVCDPIEDKDHAYKINGILVSDFYTQEYFHNRKRAGVKYSFNGALSGPREIGPNGYLSWRNRETGRLHQIRNFDGYELFDLPAFPADPKVSTRMFIDRETKTPRSFRRRR
jgi:hypothetical protein